ncbi:MAG: hypothetical protein Q8O67_21305 [Deltaproteobacteria bacterium]|nr:hypothetical protein [Deltaproteobacteria bacterium]
MRIVLVSVLALMSFGCSHVTNIESTPGVEISVDGQAVGKAPLAYTTPAGAKPVVVTVRGNGVERSQTIERTELDWTNIGIGAGIGSGACVGIGCVSGVATFIFLPAALPAALALCVGCALPFAGGGAAYMFAGQRLPDNIKVDLIAAPPSTTPPAKPGSPPTTTPPTTTPTPPAKAPPTTPPPPAGAAPPAPSASPAPLTPPKPAPPKPKAQQY